jgi:dipeptidase D
MAILESTDIPHPAMKLCLPLMRKQDDRALNLKEEFCKVKSLNMDTEEDDEIDIGCAGGMMLTILQYDEEETQKDL